MSYINTEAIALAKYTLREADRLYVLYTPEHGKIEARVKGAALSQSKLAGSLEPVALVKVMLAKGRHWETIAGVQLFKRFNFNQIDLYGYSGLIRELFLTMTKEGVKEPRLFSNLYQYLEALEKNQANQPTCRYLTMRFIWQFLNLAGFSHAGDNLNFLPGNINANHDPELTELLRTCLVSSPRPLQVSHNLLQKLESVTFNYLRQILERDLNYLSFLAS